jgi:hypothetical protein
MQKTTLIAIEVLKSCETCQELTFEETLLHEPEVARCNLTNQIVTLLNSNNEIEYKKTDCSNWGFDKRMLDDCSYFIKDIQGEVQ